ncbi:patatin-related protein [Nocardioides sp. BE266]|uniref:patatin-like phospholipase family protein n=1 Tax=Nocardioides sp. BE266 TaxID=2817725 RepID=UPI002862D75E|nr:patatin-like phospholipase family protein [Nocardioides sp. BE266]MDR7252624.1 patatin-related protein [Nocardioides sp. BE266]
MNGPPQAGSRREVRLALVMNGGVSLAVWMSGVTREIDALQHAHEDVPAGSSPAQEKYLKVWQDVLAAAHRSRVRVDLVAGTSAGGLNGALLASAIARGERLDSELRDLWVEAGSLEVHKLIQPKGSDERSLLGGGYFEQQIAKALGLVKDASGSFTMAGQAVGRQSCTLLTTATALRTPGADDLGPDSRRVYRFTHRVDPDGVAVTPGWAQSDFATHAAALARAARASASFPAAFNPVFESPDLVSRRHERIDDAASYLVDGGVLDNAPFGPLLDELRKRPIDAPFDRVLLYIKPSGSGDGTTTPLSNNPSPLSVLGRVFTASREPDDRQDVEDLVGLRDEMLYTGTMPHLLLSRSFEPGSSMSGDELTASATPLLSHYRRGRRQAFEVEADLEPSVQFDVPAISPLPQEGPLFGAMTLDQAPGSWTWGLSAADRILRWWGRILNVR